MGLPGSGKTTLSINLQIVKSTRVNADEVRKNLMTGILVLRGGSDSPIG